MKKTIRILLIAFAATLVAALGCLLSGCGLTDKVSEKIDQFSCSHVYDNGSIVQAASCSEEGVFRKTCERCGKTKDTSLDMMEHGAFIETVVPSTCTLEGYEEVKCGYCFEVVSYESLPLVEHDYVDYFFAATCWRDGCDYSMCRYCNEYLEDPVTIEALGHTTQTGICERCGTNCFDTFSMFEIGDTYDSPMFFNVIPYNYEESLEVWNSCQEPFEDAASLLSTSTNGEEIFFFAIEFVDSESSLYTYTLYFSFIYRGQQDSYFNIYYTNTGMPDEELVFSLLVDDPSGQDPKVYAVKAEDFYIPYDSFEVSNMRFLIDDFSNEQAISEGLYLFELIWENFITVAVV